MGAIVTGPLVDLITAHLGIVIAGALVALFAWGRYGDPKTNKVSTTQFHFYLTRSAYTLSALLLYVVLLNLLSTPGALDFLSGGTAAATGMSKLPAPFMAALIMTTLLPNFPIVSKVDHELLRFFQRLGSIPAKVLRLTVQLQQTTFNPAPQMQQTLRDHMRERANIPNALLDELRFGAESAEKDSARFRFTRNMGIYVLIWQLRQKEEFMGFFADFADDAKQIDNLMQSFIDQAAGFFAFSATIPPQQQINDPSLLAARNSFKNSCNSVYDELTSFLAQALLNSSWTDNQVKSYLTMLGLAPAQPKSPLLLNTVLTAGIIVFCLFGFGVWLAPTIMPSAQQGLTLALVVSINHALAALLAIAPKRLWGFANRREMGERPVAAYMLSAVLAGAAAAIVILCYDVFVLKHGDFAAGWDRFSQVFPWSFLPATASFMLAALCDVNVPQEKPLQKWVEAAAMAVVLAVAGLVIASLTPASENSRFIVIMSGGIGVIMGFFVPHSYRAELRRSLPAQAGAPAAPPVDKAA